MVDVLPEGGRDATAVSLDRAGRRRSPAQSSLTQIERGMATLRERGLVKVTKSARDPRNPRSGYSRPRNVYTNHLDGSDPEVAEVGDFAAVMARLDAEVQALPRSAADIPIDGSLDEPKR